MSTLETIVAYKKKEVEEKKALIPTKLLEQSIYFPTATISLAEYLKRDDKIGVIAEIKRRSPSNPEINPNVNVERTSIGYMQSGASALSVLTDNHFFGGTNEDLTVARKFNFCPILRKDFIIDEYQIVEAKSIGADAILLIAAVLTEPEIKRLATFAQSLDLEILMEIHDESELNNVDLSYVHVLGVNNRNLKTMEVNLETSMSLAEKLPQSTTKISESGIKSAEDAAKLKQFGYDGFLIGELFMKCTRPERACMQFIDELMEMIPVKSA